MALAGWLAGWLACTSWGSRFLAGFCTVGLLTDGYIRGEIGAFEAPLCLCAVLWPVGRGAEAGFRA